MPLMEKLGYQGVFERHGGAGELGEDIVGWKASEIGSRKNKAVVVKANRMSSDVEIFEVATQVVQAFNTTFEDPTSGDLQLFHDVWVVS